MRADNQQTHTHTGLFHACASVSRFYRGCLQPPKQRAKPPQCHYHPVVSGYRPGNIRPFAPSDGVKGGGKKQSMWGRIYMIAFSTRFTINVSFSQIKIEFTRKKNHGHILSDSPSEPNFPNIFFHKAYEMEILLFTLFGK